MSRFTMRDRQSNRTRPVPERAILLAEGSHVQAYRLRGYLDRQVLFEEMLGELEVWLEPREFPSGETIVASGEPRDGLQLLRQGRASQFDSNGTRLFELSPGAVIEPRGAFDASPAANATIAVEPCRTLVLAPDVRAKLEHNEPQLILKHNAYTFTAPDRHSATA